VTHIPTAGMQEYKSLAIL